MCQMTKRHRSRRCDGMCSKGSPHTLRLRTAVGVRLASAGGTAGSSDSSDCSWLEIPQPTPNPFRRALAHPYVSAVGDHIEYQLNRFDLGVCLASRVGLAFHLIGLCVEAGGFERTRGTQWGCGLANRGSQFHHRLVVGPGFGRMDPLVANASTCFRPMGRSMGLDVPVPADDPEHVSVDSCYGLVEANGCNGCSRVGPTGNRSPRFGGLWKCTSALKRDGLSRAVRLRARL